MSRHTRHGVVMLEHHVNQTWRRIQRSMPHPGFSETQKRICMFVVFCGFRIGYLRENVGMQIYPNSKRRWMTMVVPTRPRREGFKAAWRTKG